MVKRTEKIYNYDEQSDRADIMQLIGMIGMTTKELSAYFQTLDLKASPRTIRRWELQGYIPLGNRCYDEIVWLWEKLYDYKGLGPELPKGLPQHVYDRHAIIDMYRPGGWVKVKPAAEPYDGAASLVIFRKMQADIGEMLANWKD